MRIFVLFLLLLPFACSDTPSAIVPIPTSELAQLEPLNDSIPPLPPPPDSIEATKEASEGEAMEVVAEEKSAESVLDAAPPSAAVAPSRQQSSAAPPPNHERGSGPAGAVPAGFSDLQSLDPSILIDIKYATTDNFTHAQIYDCGRCLLRTEAAEALVKVHKSLKKRGLRLKMFDCYRPRPYQQRLWDKVPNPDYVTPPNKGSMHSRGAAVDLTLVDAEGHELEMGTPYDFFGKEAHTDYLQHPKKVLQNRNILRDALLEQGFKGIRTEWWHFSYQKRSFPLSSVLWTCP